MSSTPFTDNLKPRPSPAEHLRRVPTQQDVASEQPLSPMTALPIELLTLILSHCGYADTMAFLMTCKTFNLSPKPTSYNMDDLLRIERWPCYDPAGRNKPNIRQPIAGSDFFACGFCLRLRSAEHFSNHMMRGKRGKHSGGANANIKKRTCIKCAIREGKYKPGYIFEFGGAKAALLDPNSRAGRGLVCRKCRGFGKLGGSEGRICATCIARHSRFLGSLEKTRGAAEGVGRQWERQVHDIRDDEECELPAECHLTETAWPKYQQPWKHPTRSW